LSLEGVGRELVFAFTEPAWFITNAKTSLLTVAPIAFVLMAMAVCDDRIISAVARTTANGARASQAR
jgi:hypothetical protein